MKPLSPTSLVAARAATPTPTEDPPSSPISSVLGALGKTNSSGAMSTADALESVRTTPRSPTADVLESLPTAPRSPTADALDAVRPAPAAPRLSGASPAISVPPVLVEDEPPPLPPIAPSVVVSDDPRTTVPGPAPAPKPAPMIDASPSTEPMPVASPYPSATPYLNAAAATSASAATQTIPGVGVGDTPRPAQTGDDDLRAPKAAWLALLTPRNLAIGGGALVLLIVVIVFATRGGDHETTAAKKPPAAETDKHPTETVVAKTEEPAPPPDEASEKPSTTETPAETGSATEATTSPPETGSAVAPKPRPIRRPTTGGSTIGGKQVVLEDDAQARDTSAAPPANVAKSDQSAITKARTAYSSGNQRLFAGDPAGAIKAYKQALAYYPAYVAGYRGLGLAYAQQGNKAQALQAFKTYVASVPNAKDAGLIRKRITTLQAH